MNLLTFEDYKEYVKTRIKHMPKNGRGELQRISSNLGIHSTRLSHILRGEDHITLEQGLRLCQHFGFKTIETQYFMLLLQEAKAGTLELKKYFQSQRSRLQNRAQQISTRVPGSRKLNDSEKAIFYSNWYYSALRLLTSLPGHHTIDSLSNRFSLPRRKVNEALDFLITNGLCRQDDRSIQMGPASTHLESTSPLVTRLHSNWRIKAMEKHSNLSSSELVFTSPMSIEKKHFAAIRALLLEAIEKSVGFSDTQSPNMLACLNIDWFEF